MRIAQLANFVGPTSGGMKVVIDQLGQGYLAAGHERVFIHPGHSDGVTEDERGIVVSIRSPRISQSYRMIAQPRPVLEALARFGPTSVEISDKWTLSPLGRWAHRRGVGSVLFSHERLVEMMTQWLRASFGVETIVGALNRRLAQEFDTVVVTSQYAADEFENTPARLALVPLGVDLDTFHPSIATPDDDHILKLVYVGRLSREKMPQLAVETAVALHERRVPVRLDLYGSGPDESWLRGLAEGAPVHFGGHLKSRREVAQRFAAADLSLSCSPTETFGLAVLEALACGTPVVTSDRGGARELIDDDCGAAAPPDPQALAQAALELAALPGARAAARRRAEQYGWSRTVERMLAVHQEVTQ